MMNVKPFLKSFWQVVCIFKIFGLQALGLFFVAYGFGLIFVVQGARGCPSRSDLGGPVFYVIVAASLLAGFLSFHPIFFPRVWLEEIGKELLGSKVAFRFPFFSTHPTYVLLDLLLLIPAILMFWNGQSLSLCEANGEWGQGLAALVMGIAFPALRLIFWFILGKQIYAMQVTNPWQPILWWYLLTLPVIIFFSYTYITGTILPKSGIPVINSENFKNAEDFRPEFVDKIVKVEGTIKQGIAKCGLFGKKDREDFPYGTVVIELAKGKVEVMVQAKKPAAVLDLEAESKRNGIFEAYGRLSKLPNPEKKMLCGIEKLRDKQPKGGRYLLEIEMQK